MRSPFRSLRSFISFSAIALVTVFLLFTFHVSLFNLAIFPISLYNPTMFNVAFNLHSQGKLDEAEKIYREIINKEPDNAQVYNLLGLIE